MLLVVAGSGGTFGRFVSRSEEREESSRAAKLRIPENEEASVWGDFLGYNNTNSMNAKLHYSVGGEWQFWLITVAHTGRKTKKNHSLQMVRVFIAGWWWRWWREVFSGLSQTHHCTLAYFRSRWCPKKKRLNNNLDSTDGFRNHKQYI